MAEHGFTPGKWRAVAMGGSSTVLCHFRPRHNNTAAPTYGYREDGDYCIATPFKDDGGLVRPDFVSFSHDDARLIAASPTLLEAVQNLMGLFDNPVYRQRLKDNALYPEVIQHARAAITLATGKDA